MRKSTIVRIIRLYFLQLVLNAAWTPIFVGAHQPGWALVDILALWIAILLTLLTFLRVSKAAGWLLVPYLAWVTFAAFLNFTLWRMNPPVEPPAASYRMRDGKTTRLQVGETSHYCL